MSGLTIFGLGVLVFTFVLFPAIASLTVCAPKWYRHYFPKKEETLEYVPFLDRKIIFPSWIGTPFKWFVVIVATPFFAFIILLTAWLRSWSTIITRACPYSSHEDVQYVATHKSIWQKLHGDITTSMRDRYEYIWE